MAGIIGGASDANRINYAKVMTEQGGVTARLEPFIGGAQRPGWPAEAGQKVELHLGDRYLGTTTVPSQPKVLPEGSAARLSVVARALESFAQGGGETARLLMDTAKRIGAKVPAVFNLAPVTVGLAANAADARDPAKVAAFVDRIAKGDPEARLQFESLLPTDPLRQAVQRGIDKKFLGAEDA
ncbi:hypothetical protein L6R52_40265 [Myxococcota bacterium]|nr:hypothetical protein [Myxococcota bacterium]